MARFKILLLVCVGSIFLLSGCATFQKETVGPYSRTSLLQFYKLTQWTFGGRVAITGQKDSWWANISWEHNADKDLIRLSGPLGQGATVIRLTGDMVTVDRGNGDVQSSVQPDVFVSQQVGITVPVQSLRYWVLGLPEPTQVFEENGSGFKQSGWQVEYKQMQPVDNQAMPRKITVMNEQVKLKLIIDQWAFNDSYAK
ncbi:MAG: lipoprotein insertase outer membrane protein LolB [Methylovulum sp.]|nr:lipoprotein insertase outer membrane protein LolB [Methylovulum sp.]